MHGTDLTTACIPYRWWEPGLVPVAQKAASAERPENTWAAFELALQQGATCLEGDWYLTKDKHLVQIHDPWLNRTSDLAGLVGSKTVAELKQGDFGGWHASAKLGRSPGRHQHNDRGRVRGKSKELGTRKRPWPAGDAVLRGEHSVKYNYDVERQLVEVAQRHDLTNPDFDSSAPGRVLGSSRAA